MTGLAAHVVGLADDVRGQTVAAVLRVPAGRTVSVEELRDRLAERLSAYKVPKSFLLLAENDVPTPASGKPDRAALEALFDVR